MPTRYRVEIAPDDPWIIGASAETVYGYDHIDPETRTFDTEGGAKALAAEFVASGNWENADGIPDSPARYVVTPVTD